MMTNRTMPNMRNMSPDSCSGRMLNIMRTDSLPLGRVRRRMSCSCFSSEACIQEVFGRMFGGAK